MGRGQANATPDISTIVTVNGLEVSTYASASHFLNHLAREI
jgi:hypothetical protein